MGTFAKGVAVACSLRNATTRSNLSVLFSSFRPPSSLGVKNATSTELMDFIGGATPARLQRLQPGVVTEFTEMFVGTKNDKVIMCNSREGTWQMFRRAGSFVEEI